MRRSWPALSAAVATSVALVSLGGCAPRPLSRPGGGVGPQTSKASSGAPTWKRLGSAPTKRTEVATASVGNRIYVIGGFTLGGGSVKKVEIYDAARDAWKDGPDLPIAVNHAMAVSLDDEVYVLGGYRGPGLSNPTNRGFVLSIQGWNEISAMPEVRAAAGAAAVRGKLIVAGGVGERGLADTLLSYDPDTKTWTGLSELLPTPREHLGVAGFDGRLYVVGGRTGGIGTNLNSAEVYDQVSLRWDVLPPLPTARGGIAAAATSNGFVVAPGGEAD